MSMAVNKLTASAPYRLRRYGALFFVYGIYHCQFLQ